MFIMMDGNMFYWRMPLDMCLLVKYEHVMLFLLHDDGIFCVKFGASILFLFT